MTDTMRMTTRQHGAAQADGAVPQSGQAVQKVKMRKVIVDVRVFQTH